MDTQTRTQVHADLADPSRVAGIRDLEVLDAPPRTDLVAVADLAARVCGVSLATINLITDVEQHQIATAGFEGGVCSIEDSMCAATLSSDGPIVVPDCRVDPRFSSNPFVTGRLGEVRFYASARLITRAGLVIGTLCVFDEQVRDLDQAQRDGLVTLAERVVDVLELSLRSRELSATLAEVEAVRARLEKSNERLASFAGQVSHDLKSPLTTVALSLGMIRDELARRPDQAAALPLLDRAIGGSDRMAALIDDILAFARLGGELTRSDVDLGQLLTQVRADLWDRLDGVELVAGDLPVVRGDAVQLRAVLQNLVDNAAKYADPGRPARVQVAGRRTTTGWRVSITDNGRGVAEADRERIFEPLARADTSVAGSGIGLTTCRRIVEAHGGEIGLDPVPTGGTTVWFELPD